MTNHKSLAIVIPMLLAASNGVNALEIFNKNGNKLEIHGSINPSYELTHSFFSTKVTSHNDTTNAVIGLSGEINIADELFSYASVEYSTDFSAPEELLNKQQSNTVRLGYAGFKYGNWGSIDYGRNYGVFHDVQALTDHIPYINKNSVFACNDNYMIGRNNGLLTYKNSNLFGLINGMSLTLQHQNENNNREEYQQNGSGWGASLKYESDVGLTAIGSFFSSERSQVDKNNNQNQKFSSVGAYGLGFKYDANNIYIAAFYGESHNLTPSFHVITQNNLPNEQSYINKTQNIEAIAEYNFSSGFHPSLSYLDSKGQNSNTLNSSSNQDLELAKQINISTRYEFNKNISTYMNYKINLLKNNNFIQTKNISTDNIIGAGIVYHF